MVILVPVVKLNDTGTFNVFNVLPLDFVVVRLQDIVSAKTFGFGKTFRDVVSAGGLHNFLGFSGHIILSLIMKDEIIANFNPEKYAAAIDSLRPNSFTTVDGETYEGEYSLSLKEINRSFRESKELLRLCPNYTPIGLVKGCGEDQVENHIVLLKSLGITDFVLHVGDFFRHGDENMIRRARSYASRIRKHARHLMLYGMGSQKKLSEFSFADVYITFNHFVTAMNGMKFVGTRKVKYSGGFRPKIIIGNFIEMYKNVNALNNQRKLWEW